MSVPPLPDSSTELPGTPAEVLSTDPHLRAIELAFLRRLLSSVQLVNAKDLQDGDSSHESTAGAALARMQSLTFKLIARELERDVPAGLGFGRFRGSHDKEGPT